MSTNLIQNYINKPVPALKPASSQTAPKPPFDIKNELENRTLIKPLKGKGKLVNGNIFNAPALMIKDGLYDLKALKHAAKGTANDHELGKLNDVGLKLGSLAIAAYLFTKKQTPVTKWMEFIGLGSFVGAMAIWPKLAIQLPAYLIHGVNVQKEYEDSFGRKKLFYQDPQFIPWDLYSDEEINKMGDRLKVPKDINNRRDFIQEKMKKLAVQNNTMWMLTAGFAAPIMSGLICNASEPYLKSILNNIKNKHADDILKNFDKYSEKYETNTAQNLLNDLFAANNGKTIDDKLTAKITEALTSGIDPVTAKSLEADIKDLIKSGKFKITDNTAKEIVDNILELTKGKDINEDLLKAVIPTEDEMKELLKDYKSQNLSPTNVTQINIKINKEMIKRFNQAFPQASDELKEDFDYLFEDLINGRTLKEHPIMSPIRKNTADVLTDSLQNKLKGIASILDKFTSKVSLLDEYAVTKVGDAPETVIAEYWNNSTKEILKALNITPKDLKTVHIDRNLTAEMLRDRIETISSDKEAYKKLMSTLAKTIGQIDILIKQKDLTSHVLREEDLYDEAGKRAVRTNYEIKVDDVYDSCAQKLKSDGFERTARALNGWGGVEDKGSAKVVQKALASDRLLGVKSSFYRLLNTLDYYRRVSTNVNQHNVIRGQAREIKEELIELCKYITLQGHSSDYSNKFYFKRNPQPDLHDKSDVVVKNGKVENKYLGLEKGVDIPEDKYFYQNAMQLMYEGDMHPDTIDALKKGTPKGSSLVEELQKYRNVFLEKIGGEHNFAKPRHLIRAEKKTASDIKFNLVGNSIDELIFRSGNQMLNSKKWLRTYGYFGAGLLGITVLAQFFFGKIKNPKQVEND